MGKIETPIQNKILKVLGGRPDTRLFRNNRGAAWAPNGRIVKYGVAPGGSDLIGWRVLTVTPEMIGQRVAVFVAIEVKGPLGRPSSAQKNFINRVKMAGGLAGVAKNTDQALNILDGQGEKI